MPIRLAPADRVAAARAEAELPGACRALATLVGEGAEALAALDAAVDAQACLTALVAHRRAGARIRWQEDHVLLLMHVAGASQFSLANALSINRATISRRITAAESETA